MPFSKSAVVIAALLLAGCGAHVHVRASDCAMHGAALTAHVTNVGDKPLTQAEIMADFYRNYRFTRGFGEATFSPVLDPGAERDVTVSLDIPSGGDGAPMQCKVTRAVYGDASVESESVTAQ